MVQNILRTEHYQQTDINFLYSQEESVLPVDILTKLLEAGADVNLTSIGDENETAIFAASKKGHL